jgi:hypothetical protein
MEQSMGPVEMDAAAVVVLAVSNNPRLLNADFLKRHSIVPEEWAVADTLVTPAVAQVTFENGLQVLVEENRVHFRTSRPTRSLWAEELPRIAVDYLELLPHVDYRGVGLNFVFVSSGIAGEETKTAPIKKLLKRGRWLDWRSGASGAVIELQYRKETPHMNIKISTAERKEMEEENVQRLMFNINFHHDFKAEEQKEREEYINSIEIRCAEILDFLKKLPF